MNRPSRSVRVTGTACEPCSSRRTDASVIVSGSSASLNSSSTIGLIATPLPDGEARSSVATAVAGSGAILKLP